MEEKANLREEWLRLGGVAGYVKRVIGDDVAGYYVSCEGEGAVGVGVEDYVIKCDRIDLEPAVVLWVKRLGDCCSVLVILDEEGVNRFMSDLQEALKELERKREMKILREKMLKAYSG
jgi:hypothetical protein